MNSSSDAQHLNARHLNARRPNAGQVEQLLRESAWVRALAARLSAGAHDAEDLVQEAWVAALERPPRAYGSARAWLGSVLRRRASDRARQGLRRRDRERARTPETVERGAGDSPDTTLERLELQELLARLVRELPEQERAACIATYFDGLDSRGAARRLGISASAVRGRLQRARERLRTRLDGHFDGDRGAWLTALVPVGGLAPRGAAGAAAAGLGVWSAAGLALAIALLGAYQLRPSSRSVTEVQAPALASVSAPRPGTTELAEPHGRAAATALEEQPAGRSPHEPPAGAGQAAPPAASPAEQDPDLSQARLVGRVLAGDGAALAGIEVGLAFASDPSDSGSTKTSWEYFVTDQHGELRLEFDAPRRLSRVHVYAGPRSAALALWQPTELQLGKTVELSWTVGSGGRLAGVVVDGSGAPFADAFVDVWCSRSARDGTGPDRRALTDAQGRFAIEHVGASFEALPAAPGAVETTWLSGQLADGQQVDEIRLELVRTQPFSGLVRDADGTPRAGLEVRIGGGQSRELLSASHPSIEISRGSLDRTVRTDAEGRFETEAARSGQTVLSVRAPDRPHWRRVVELESERQVEIVLQDGSRLTGLVRTAEGQAVMRARVEHQQSRGFAWTDNIGGFEITGIDPRSLRQGATLVVSDSGHALHGEQLAPGESSVEIQLQSERVLAGRVVDAEGLPVSAAQLEIARADAQLPELPRSMSSLRADSSGEFLIEGLCSGEYVLRAWRDAERHVYDEVQLAAVARERLDEGSGFAELVLDASIQRQAKISGQVRDALTGQPIASFWTYRITTTPSEVGMLDTSSQGLHIDDPTGHFTLFGDPGSYELAVSAAGYAIWNSGFQDLAAGEHHFDVELQPTRAVTLRVVDERGEPVLAWVSFRSLSGQQLRLGPKFLRDEVLLDEQREIITGLPAHKVLVRLERGELEAPVEFELDLSSEGPHAHTQVVERD